MITLMRHKDDTDSELEVRVVDGDTVQVRYIKPIESDWISETYSMDTMLAAGWEVAK